MDLTAQQQKLNSSTTPLHPNLAAPMLFSGAQFQQQIQAYSTPLPPPEVMQKYMDLGLGEKIIQMTQEQADHRRNLETGFQKGDIKHQERRDHEARWGQGLAAAIAFAAIAGVIYLTLQGHEWPAVALSTIGLTGVVTPLVQGRQDKKKK